MAIAMAVANHMWLVQGTTFPVIRPEALATDWGFHIVKVSDPTTILDFATGIANSQRHYFVDIDDRYDVDTEYEVQVFNATPAQVSSGQFQIVRGIFDSLSSTQISTINSELALACGLAGANAKWEFTSHDAATGIPVAGTLTIYTDDTLTVVLAQYSLARRLSDSRLVEGEVQWQIYPSTTGTGTGA